MKTVCRHGIRVQWQTIDGVGAWRHDISGSVCTLPPKPKATGVGMRLRRKL